MRKHLAVLAAGVALFVGGLFGAGTAAGFDPASPDFWMHCVGNPAHCDEAPVPTVTETQTVTNTETVTNTVTETVTVTQPADPAPTPGEVLFRDDFNEAIDAGTPAADLGPDNWVQLGQDGADCIFSGQNDWCADASLAWTDSTGHLVLEAKKIAGGFPDDRRSGRTVYYKTGAIETFSWDGWPPRTVLQSFGEGTRVEIRAKMPAGAGLWGGLWTHGISSSSQVTEWDINESLGNDISKQRCSVHEWLPNSFNSTVKLPLPFDPSAGFHNYWLEYRSDRVVMGVDNLTCRETMYSVGTYSPAANGERMGLLLFNQVCDSSVPDADQTCWNGNSANGATFGVANRLVVDYVQISSL